MITSAHSPLDDRIFYKEARSLRKNGYDVTVIAPATKSIKKDTLIDKIKILVVPRYKSKLLRPLTLFHLFIRGFKTNADVYHCHEPDALLSGILLKLLKRKKLIYDVHEHWPDGLSEKPFFPRFVKIIVKKIINTVEKKISGFPNYILTVDHILKKEFSKYNKKVLVVANFPEPMFFRSTEDNALMKKYNNRQLIIYVGGLTPDRGILESIKAIELVRNKIENVKLLFVGPFQDTKYEKKVLDYIKSHNLKNLVEFTGPVPYGEVPKYLGISKLGLLLLQPTVIYSKTPYPIKLFEYIGYSLPVISGNLPELRKIINEINCGISVDPTNLREISDAIIYLLENPSEAKKMGENGRKAVEEKYNWEMMEKRLLKVYDNLV